MFVNRDPDPDPLVQVQDSRGGETGLRRVCGQEPSETSGHHHHRRSENKHTSSLYVWQIIRFRRFFSCLIWFFLFSAPQTTSSSWATTSETEPESLSSPSPSNNNKTTTSFCIFLFVQKKIRLRTWTPPSKGTDTCKRSPGRQNIPRCGSRSICGALILVYSRLKITTQVSRVRIMLERRKIPLKTFHCVWRRS